MQVDKLLPDARSRHRRVAALAAVGSAIALVAVANPFVGHAAASVPSTFSPTQATAVPGSSTSFVLGNNYANGKTRTVVVKVANGKTSVATVNTTATIETIAAGSAKSIWLGGYGYNTKTNLYVPVILHSTGGAYKPVKLPTLGENASIKDMAASSATNAWAVGTLPDATSGFSDMLHWNGKVWSTVATVDDSTNADYAVATSSPSNVWLVSQDAGFEHYNGKVDSVAKTATIGGTLDSIATSSSTNAWAVGTKATSSGGSAGFTMHFSGSKWEPVATPKVYIGYLTQVSMKGNSVWAAGYSESKTKESPYLLFSTGSKWKSIAVKYKGNGGDLQTIAAVSSKKAVTFGRYFTGTGCEQIQHELIATVSTSSAKVATSKSVTASRLAPAVARC